MTFIDVGIDIGTTHFKFCAVSESRDNVVASVAVSPEWEHPRRHWTQRDAERLIADVVAGLDALVRQTAVIEPAARFRSLGIAGMAESGVLLDAQGCSVSPIIAWHDPRRGELLALAVSLGLAGCTSGNVSNRTPQKDPDIAGIFATNLFSAEGSATGVRQAGVKGGISIVGFDAGPNQIKALKDGTVQALVAQQPGKIGMDGVEQANAALTGGTPEKKIQTGFTIITKDNLDTEGAEAVYKSSC